MQRDNQHRGSAGAASQTSGGTLSENYDNALPVETQLAFGILNLDGSQNAVTSETAAQLLPLWKAVRSLSASDAAAPEEIQAVYRQIQESMSAEQMQAIAAMKLSASDMGQMAGSMSATPNATMQAAGQLPADFAAGIGGDPGAMAGGGGIPAPGSGSPSGSSSSTSARSGSASANPIVDAVITYLQGKVG